jgi:hypothetical protein
MNDTELLNELIDMILHNGITFNEDFESLLFIEIMRGDDSIESNRISFKKALDSFIKNHE